MGRTGGSVTRPERIAAQERVAKALELRKAGVAYSVIAVQCGYKTPQHAHKAVKAAILALPREQAIECRNFEAERLDRLMLAYWKKALDGDQHAADYVLKVMGRRAALLGLDAPQKVQAETVLYQLDWGDRAGGDEAEDDGTEPDDDPTAEDAPPA